MISPLLANVYLHVLDTELSRRNVGELVRYADDGVVLCRSAAQAEHALAAVGEILASLGLRLHPDKTKVVDLREGRERPGLSGLSLPGPHVGAVVGTEAASCATTCTAGRPSGPWPGYGPRCVTAPAATGSGIDIRDVIAELNPILRGWGNYFRTGNAATKFRQIDWYVVWRLCRLDDQEAGPQPACWTSRSVDRGVV